MPSIRITNVTKKFGKIVAVDNVSLEIRDREYFSLLGPSGCGKTTLLRLIAGLIEPDEGKIYIGDRLVNDVPPEDRDIGFVFQTFALFPHMTVWDNATYGPKVKGFNVQQTRTIGHEVLELVKLHERLNALPSELSGGMMQRTAIARALAAGAKTLLLDEPLGQLDAKVRNEIRYDMRRMAKDLGLTAVHVTHDQAEAMSISDRIAVMRKGKVLQVGSPEELYMSPGSIFVAHFIGESNFLEGHISETFDESAMVQLRGGIQVEAATRNAKRDARVVLAIRPEAVMMEKSGAREKRSANALIGTVEKVTFEGNNVRYDIRLENQDPVVVVQPSLTDSWFDVGQIVTLSFEPEKAHVFVYPERGLKEETASE